MNKSNACVSDALLPTEIVLAPEWWNKTEHIVFDRDFFFHPLKRVEEERHMEKVLYDRWGQYGLGQDKDQLRPEVGAVHLAAGFLLSEMLGCRVNYSENHPPQVICAKQDLEEINPEKTRHTEAFMQLSGLMDALKQRFGYLTGDVNWGGILNIALDVRGETIFTDMMLTPESANAYFYKISAIIEQFTTYIQAETGTTSISVNRGVRHIKRPVLLHSECSHTMISAEDYERFLLPFDQRWSLRKSFGIHYCGPDPHRMAASFAKIPHLDYLDLGWGGDVKTLRRHLPTTFFNLRISPVEIARQTCDEIRDTIIRLVKDSGNPFLTGVCCINMDETVSDNKISTIFETVEELKKEIATQTSDN